MFSVQLKSLAFTLSYPSLDRKMEIKPNIEREIESRATKWLVRGRQ